MDKEKLQHQRELATSIDDKLGQVMEELQLGGFHAENCAIFRASKDEGVECDCVVAEFSAKVDAAGELLLATLEEREKEVR